MSHLCWRRVCAVSWRSWQPWNNEWAVIIPALMNSSRLRAPRTTDNVISHLDTFSYNYAAKFAHSLLLPAFFLSTAGFRRVQTVRSNRTITFWQAFSSGSSGHFPCIIVHHYTNRRAMEADVIDDYRLIPTVTALKANTLHSEITANIHRVDKRRKFNRKYYIYATRKPVTNGITQFHILHRCVLRIQQLHFHSSS